MNRSQVLKLSVAMVSLPTRVVSNSIAQARVSNAQKQVQKSKGSRSAWASS